MDTKSTEILFDKFEIIDCLKKDAQTGVYLANHIYLGKKIILKTLDTNKLSDNSILERFKREAKILASLSHPNIIKVLDFGTYNEFFYISFEHFDSNNLRDLINKNNLSVNDKINLLVQLLNALKAAHKNQIIHRDIKPENILVNSNLELKIADFGLALVINENSLTNNTSILGTPTYMAPEQINGEKTFQTDIFSTGLVAYELFTGINPILGDEITITINNIINFNDEKLNDAIEKLPLEVRPVIKIMLQKRVEDRAKSVDEIFNYLNYQHVDNGIKIEKKNILKNRKPYIAAFFTLIILLLVFLFGRGYKSNQLKNQNTVGKPILENLTKKDFKKENSKKLSQDIKNNLDKSKLAAVRINTNSKKKLDLTDAQLPGMLYVDCFPWAEVYIDNKKVDRTPLQNEIMLTPGLHEVKLVHPDYPPIVRNLEIVSQKTKTIKVNFQEVVGYLSCNIYPWGEIFIDGKSVGITPLRKPIALLPGKYMITVKNSQYESISRQVTISAEDTINFNYNFAKSDN
jgi:serine/threonine-protein kinase